jgi:hypothetical protein
MARKKDVAALTNKKKQILKFQLKKNFFSLQDLSYTVAILGTIVQKLLQRTLA